MRSRRVAVLGLLAGVVFAGCDETETQCGGFSGNTHACTATEYCAYMEGDSCGAADAPAFCRPRPIACAHESAPVCGCDGVTYDNACEAAMAGTGVNNAGACQSALAPESAPASPGAAR